MFGDQSGYPVRCEWGNHGLHEVAPSDVTIIVDVLSFSTCVELAMTNKAVILPYPMGSDSAEAYATRHEARLASKRGEGDFSLSPASMSRIPGGTRLVLPSPNGSHLTFHSKAKCVLAGCLRNARAVAEFALRQGNTVTVIPAGERWNDDGTLRPAIEDHLGAGAIIEHLGNSISPEAGTARAAFRDARGQLQDILRTCASGRELVEKGFEVDVRLAAELDVSTTTPLFQAPVYVNAGSMETDLQEGTR